MHYFVSCKKKKILGSQTKLVKQRNFLIYDSMYTVKPVLTDTSLNRTPLYYGHSISVPSYFIICCLKYTCYNEHLSNAYNGQLICAQEALIRLNEPV